MLMISGLEHHTRPVEGHSICLDLRTRMQFFAFQHLMHFCGLMIVGVSVVHGLVTPGQGHASGSLSQNNMQSKGGMMTFVVIRNGTC